MKRPTTLAEALARYEAAFLAERPLAPRTRAAYAAALRRFATAVAAWTAQGLPTALTQHPWHLMEAYRVALDDRGVGPGACQHELFVVRAFYTYLARREVLVPRPVPARPQSVQPHRHRGLRGAAIRLDGPGSARVRVRCIAGGDGGCRYARDGGTVLTRGALVRGGAQVAVDLATKHPGRWIEVVGHAA